MTLSILIKTLSLEFSLRFTRVDDLLPDILDYMKGYIIRFKISQGNRFVKSAS